MNLVVYEHITSGALGDKPLPESLAHEGDMMLSAIVQDLMLLSDMHITVLRDARLGQGDWLKINPKITVKTCAGIQEFETYWQACLEEQSHFLLIAPETDHILLDLQQQVLAAGKMYIGCSIAATRICSNKLHCYQQLLKSTIATPVTFSADKALLDLCLINQPYIVKPVDGAGCLNTIRFESLQQTREFLISLSQASRNNLIVQPFIEGPALSISIYRDDDTLQLLSINQQLIEQHAQQFVFHGCVMNNTVTHPFSEQQAMLLANQIDQAITGLSGYVGIDFILSDQGPVVVDINPRLTTAYVNLTATGRDNPALPLWQHLHRLNQQEAHYA